MAAVWQGDHGCHKGRPGGRVPEVSVQATPDRAGVLSTRPLRGSAAGSAVEEREWL
jgi:hypothetical protein